MFCYTSGTTGDPKAAMISHKNLIAFLHHMDMINDDPTIGSNENDISFSYLPYAHIFEQITLIYSLNKGFAHGFYSGDTLKLFEDIAALKPT